MILIISKGNDRIYVSVKARKKKIKFQIGAVYQKHINIDPNEEGTTFIGRGEAVTKPRLLQLDKKAKRVMR